jgi:hypothetical protein
MNSVKFMEARMIVGLWLLLATSTNANLAHVGDFTSMRECTAAASDAKPVPGTAQGRDPAYSFVCVQSK